MEGIRVSTYATNTLKILDISWIKKLKVNDCFGSKVNKFSVLYGKGSLGLEAGLINCHLAA